MNSLHKQHIQLTRGDLYQLGRRLVTCPGWCRLQFRHTASLFPVTYSVVFHGDVHKVRIWVWWCVAEPGWEWWKIQFRKFEPQVHTNHMAYPMHFKRYDSATDFREERTSIYACPSASHTLLPTARWWEMPAYKSFRNMTLCFSAREFFVFLLIISVFPV